MYILHGEYVRAKKRIIIVSRIDDKEPVWKVFYVIYISLILRGVEESEKSFLNDFFRDAE